MKKLGVLPLVSSIIAVAMLFSAFGCGDSKEPTHVQVRAKTLKKGTLRVGSDIPYKPFEFGRAPDYRGFDIDLVKEVSKRLGLKMEVVNTAFDPIFRYLSRGAFDVVAAAAPITSENEKLVDFSNPYFRADLALVVRRSEDIHSFSDLRGKAVGAQLGTAGALFARDKTDASVRNFDAISDAFNALSARQVDAVIHYFAQAQDETRNNRALQIVDTVPTKEVYGLAFNKKSDTLRQAVDDALDEMKRDGTFERIYRRWFRQTPPGSIAHPSG